MEVIDLHCMSINTTAGCKFQRSGVIDQASRRSIQFHASRPRQIISRQPLPFHYNISFGSQPLRQLCAVSSLPKTSRPLANWRIPIGAIVTASAGEVAAARGVRFIELPDDQCSSLAAAEKTIAIGADHGGFVLKEALKPLIESLGLTVRDVGVYDTKPADYPDIAVKVADLVASGAATRGVLIDGAGIGSSMAANKVPGIRAALCYDKASARNSREHNDSNVLTLGARLLTADSGGGSPAHLDRDPVCRRTAPGAGTKNHGYRAAISRKEPS